MTSIAKCTLPALLSRCRELTTKMPKAKRTKISRTTLVSVNTSGKPDPSFFQLVYEVAKQIPYGRVTSYGAIAACLGTKLSARMVGWAMNGAHYEGSNIPAHRVVNRVGLLTGKMHFGEPDKMQELLEAEGIKVDGDKVVDFQKHFWDPSTELE
jgi:methylated-DNA-protein-cysteine methyltransferase related protein